MTIITWKRVTPKPPSPTVEGPTTKQLQLTDYEKPMPEQTIPVEEARQYAQENCGFGGVDREILERIERISGEERYQWKEHVQECNNNHKAFKMMKMDPDFPSDALHAIKEPEEWEILDPEDVDTVVCSATDKELYHVEVHAPNYDLQDDGTTYIDSSGAEYGGQYISETDSEYYDVEESEDQFINGQILMKMSVDNSASTSIVTFQPAEEDGGEVSKSRIEKVGSVRRDLSFEDGSYSPISEHPEVEALIDAIIEGDEENEALEGWVPVEARPEDGTNRDMEHKVKEIANTTADGYYFDFPTVAVLGREGPISGKRYVAVPEEHAEDADEWFDPELY